MEVWLSRDVAFHPRGYYRIALSLAKRWQVRVYGRQFPSTVIEGPLEKLLDEKVWHRLTAPPKVPTSIEVYYVRGGGGGAAPAATNSTHTPPSKSTKASNITIICNPADLWRRFFSKRLVWDVWEDYGQNFRYDPAYSPFRRLRRRLLWTLLLPLRKLPDAYTLAEYTYAPLFPLQASYFLPNAFVQVETEPPLLPDLAGRYTLYTGNLAESWGIMEALQKALETPQSPFILAGSTKSPHIETRIRRALNGHRCWLWIRSRFVPYPVIQNLQRYAALLYALYQPLPHLRDKIPGKFYEAAALGIPILYPEGKSAVWDAFWRRYRKASDASELYWEHYEEELLALMECLLAS